MGRIRRTGLVAVGVLVIVALAGLTACDPADTTLNGNLTLPGGGGAVPAGTSVTVYADDTATALASASTDAAGHFFFRETAVPSGTYRLSFGASGWWEGASSWSDATAVVVAAGKVTTVNASVDVPTGAISGTVTAHGLPLANATVTAVSATDGVDRFATTTAPDGTYRFAGLPNSTFLVRFEAPGLARQWNGGAALPGSASPLTPPAGSELTGVDAALVSESTLSGTVWGAPGDRSGVVVVAYEKATGTRMAVAATSSAGAFSVRGLPAGTYSLAVTDPGGRFRPDVWGTTSTDPTAGTGFAAKRARNTSVGSFALKGIDCPRASRGADLSGADLRGRNLTGCDFVAANLSGADLSGASLYNVNAASAYFTGADLSATDLTGVSFFGTDLGNASLRSASMPSTSFAYANLQDADFAGASLGTVTSGHLVGGPQNLPASWTVTRGYLVGPRANLAGADLTGVDFSGRDLSGTSFLNAKVTGAAFTGANLTGTSFFNAVLTGVTFDGVDLSRSTLTGVTSGGVIGTPTALPSGWAFHAGTLFGRQAIVTGADIEGADLATADLAGITSGGLAGTPASLPARWAYVDGWLIGAGTRVVGADLSGADLSQVDLTGVTSSGISGVPAALPAGWTLHNGYLVGRLANLPSAQLAGLSMPGADLRGTNLSGSDLSGADLSGADLGGAQLGNVRLAGADLTGADLTGTNVYGVDLSDARLADAVLRSNYSGAIKGAPQSMPVGRALVNGYLIEPGAQIPYADLSGNSLAGYDLSGANLSMAMLNEVDLTATVLSGANLTGATLTNCQVDGTVLSGATLLDLYSGGLIGTPAALPTGWSVSGGALLPPE